ncbi:serine hydrolase [Hanstruepera neustonica]|uniref:Beta-lactamase n=1 Tax=Hanstruepera neustonica TaxID=1445657 RepID=A0A2K1DWZ3_9FLAO|nr:serine hydrolase [Hanstruepera neustonica]PNQ72552.1 serine hydrolase [Hanstruepera neustonica]
MMKYLVSCLFLFLSFQAISQVLIPDAVKENIQARVESGENVGISIAYIEGDQVDFYNYGTTDLKHNIPVNEHTVYEIGSISKVFTCIMLADEVLKGTMKLSDPITMYLPKGVKVPNRNGKEITLLDLATHTSALPRMPDNFNPKDPRNPYVDYTPELIYEFLSSYELTRDIGSQYEYSNYAMGLLGHILELHTGKSYETLLIEKIAHPCNMMSTKLTLTDSMKNHLAKPHAQGVEVSNWDLTGLAGAGGIRSTTEDMVRFLQVNMGVSKPAIFEAMTFSQQVAYENQDDQFKIGLGWHYAQNGDDTIIWHNGATGGYKSFTGFVDGTQKGVVVLGNADTDIGRLGMKLLGDPRPLEKPTTSIATVINKEIDANGMESAIKLYHQLKTEQPDTYKFDENQLNTLAYKYLSEDKPTIALELFKLNVASFPNASNPYDSLGEGYLKVGDTTQAITNYKKSLELNPANDNAKTVLLSLGVAKTELVTDVEVPIDVMDTYCGQYELAPGFIITVTRQDNQLFAQATGQPQFELFASAHNKFYLKVVDAQVTFNANEKGKIDSLTLHQNGQDMPANKIE